MSENRPTPQALQAMRDRPGTWAAYQNMDLGHPDAGHMRFLKVGPECTLKTAPPRYPDTSDTIGWRYLYLGMVNLETGVVDVAEKKEAR